MSSKDFTGAVLDLVTEVPPGMATSYGEVAAALGTRAPRVVGYILARYGEGMPWWRVVRADGSPPRGHETEALMHYRAENTPLWLLPDGGYRLDFSRCFWRPA